MGIIRKIALFTLFVALGGAASALAAFPAELAYAGTYDISKGNVTIDCSSGTQLVTGKDENNNNHNSEADPNPIITGGSLSSPASNVITITIAQGHTATVNLSDVHILLSDSSDAAALSISGGGDAVIILEGTNTLKSGNYHAGIEKNDTTSTGTLEIRGDGSLNVTGGQGGAGIGGGDDGDGSNIKISGGTVSANGGDCGGAGIGGGNEGDGSNIEITGGTVTATGKDGGAGIGGGDMSNSYGGAGFHIKITGGTVTATGKDGGAGIGGGDDGDGSDIEIAGGTVTATGGEYGAGIGGGYNGDGSNIKISGGIVTANGGFVAAGIGGGIDGDGSNIKISGGTVTAISGGYGAGIGGGGDGDGSNIEITGGTVYAFGSYVGAGIGRGKAGTVFDIRISRSAKVNVAGGAAVIGFDAGAAIGNGGTSGGSPGTEFTPDTSGLYTTGYIKYYVAGTSVAAMKNGTGVLTGTVTGTIPDPSQPETPSEEIITVTVSDNKPMAVSTETRGDYKITYAHEISFYGKGKVTPESFGGITVSQGNATYKVTKIKVNKKKHTFQITGLSGADKDTVKKIKKATKGSRLPFKCNPYYVRDTDKVTPKFKKNGTLKSVKIFINSKDYKAKKDEYSYDSNKKLILFKGKNLNGSYTSK